ncbi:MAG: hypothetical protein KBC96_04790 [Armatimonadetes bacterium]|nr:hypothetical protein [Armatimonadota bacterium]
MSPYEITMLVCFGASWPFSVHRTWKTKNVVGKSPIFLSLVIVGYAGGIFHKILYNPDPVVWLYALNAVMVAADLVLWFRYRERPACRASDSAAI